MVKMRFLRGLVGLSLSLACLSSCDSVFDVHPYDVRVKGETQINAKQIVKIEELMKSKDTIRFAFISDTHQYLSDFSDEVADINKRDSIDFVIHGGDMTDFGGTREFEWAREKLFKLKVPFVALLGNHDCLGTGDQAYLEMFGSPDFSFIAARIKFVCLNTNAMEFDYSKPVPNFDYMESQVTENASDFDRTVICMHAAPYCEQFNNNVANVFNYYTQKFPNLMFCLYVLRLLSPEIPYILLPQHPPDGIGNIALPAAIGPYDDRHAIREFHCSFIGKGLEPLHCQTK